MAPVTGLASTSTPICYSKYLAFDATTDPLSDGKHPCEVTSQAALETEINSMLATLDAGHIAAGRIDTVAHSMGGLVLRNYASLSGYASFETARWASFTRSPRSTRPRRVRCLRIS